ncbi:hypothetical protein, partial [Streptomyces sp. NRRL S-495]|uniref:hypothetical protein n=1 Tax=Streptomyces sp. NRRL S-495 TaxID=1609133 RepID=UPI000B0585FA
MLATYDGAAAPAAGRDGAATAWEGSALAIGVHLRRRLPGPVCGISAPDEQPTRRRPPRPRHEHPRSGHATTPPGNVKMVVANGCRLPRIRCTALGGGEHQGGRAGQQRCRDHQRPAAPETVQGGLRPVRD